MKDLIKRVTAKCENCKNSHRMEFHTESGTEVEYQCDTNEFFADIDPDGWCYKYEPKNKTDSVL